VADAALSAPINGTIELAGPDRIGMDEAVARFLRASKDPRRVITDSQAGYYGAALDDTSLVPIGDNPRIAPTRFDDWLTHSVGAS
jgi:uncharacterized protein YbjT (DUF2867 family)